MNLMIEYLPVILIGAFFTFLIFAILKSQKSQKTILSKYNKSFEYQETMMDRQVQALKLMEETNRLLAEILAATKKGKS